MMGGNNRQAKLYGIARVLVLAAALLISGNVRGQRYPFHNLNVDDGLIQSQATCLAQDRTGNLWVGTLGGLSRYDGRNFTSYTVRNGMLSNEVGAVAIDSSGNVWVGGQSGISMFNGRIFVHYSRQRQIPAHGITNSQQIVIVNDTVWWRASGELYYITKAKISYYPTPGPAGAVSAFLPGKDGIWVAKDGALFRIAGNRCDTVRFSTEAGQKPTYVYKLLRAADGTLFEATGNGLYKLDGKQLVPVSVLPELFVQPPVITSMTQDKAGALWLGTTKGVVRLADNTSLYYNKHNGLSDNGFFDLFTDTAGDVWLASDGQGIFRFSGTRFTALDETMGLSSAQVMAITGNRRDTLFLGTYDAGLFIYTDGKVAPLSFPSNPVPGITTLCHTGVRLWIGTRGRGLWTYTGKIFRQYEAPARNFPSNNITSLYESPDQRLWIGFSNGAMLYEHDSFKTIPIKPGAAISFLSLGADSTLIATGNGLQLYHADIVDDFHTGTIADSAKVQCFVKQGRYLWLGSSDNGLLRYDPVMGKTLVISKANGLRSDFVYNLVADDQGNIWAGTGFGIHRISMGPGDLPQVTFYGKAQGVTGMESNINAVLKLPGGDIWFGTTNGALHYQPKAAVVSSAPSGIVLLSVRLTDESAIDRSYYDSASNWYGIPYHLRLPYNKNSVAFSYQAISLSGAQQALYRYRMDGLEASWSQWSATNSVSYSALPPGSYTFYVQCQGADGRPAPELTYQFEIITPFQKTGWFRIAILAACLLAGVMLQAVAGGRKQRRLRLLAKLRAEEQAKVRLRTAEDFHDEIGNKLTRINVLTSVLKNKIAPSPETTRILGQIEENTAQLYGGTRDILWSLKPSNDNLYEILQRIHEFGNELFQDTDIEFAFPAADDKWRKYRLPMDMSRNLLMIFKEALNNSLKYAQAKHIWMEITLRSRGVLQIVLKDDGNGFDVQTVTRGNGMVNMQVRAGRLNGRLYIDSRKDKGTIINLTFKIPPA